ncbi:AraC family transcriptional regulator [Paenibacillus sp. FSL H8-0548]|uniref:helix-turn-helix domain-containing protein n=1 Tax=Paenibacillus sp. FSL H8-0548 TaxID=1920422 RepID=UPI0015C2F36E|nr:AraC family transcriptional regulator [Paenibacillus sp. FSL H8-0548]
MKNIYNNISWGDNVEWLPSIDWNVKFFGAHKQQVPYQWSVPSEKHIAFELNLILEGEQETIMEGNSYRLQAGDMILIPPGFKHVNRCVSEPGMLYFCAHFNVDDPSFRQEMIKHDRILFLSGTSDNKQFRAIINEWIIMSRSDGLYSSAERFRLQALLFELFGLLAQMIASKAGAKEPLAPAKVKYAKAIAETMKSRFNSHLIGNGQQPTANLKIEDLAALLGISPGYALEVFQDVYGMSPRQYLSELKLHEAKVLIRQPDLSLKEISIRLGYANLSHFSRQFKRWTGMSPLQFRKTWDKI